MENIIINGPQAAKTTFILAHGAGAGMDTPFMESFANNLSNRGAKVVRFEFPYMSKRRETGKKRPPDRGPILLEFFQDIIRRHPSENLIIGGKSMGGRIASMIAADSELATSLAGCICLGYPFHPPGKLDKLRLDHFPNIKVPTLICQGERDTFGTKEQVLGYNLQSPVELCWLNDGDHSFKPRVRSGFKLEQNIDVACEKIANKFMG